MQQANENASRPLHELVDIGANLTHESFANDLDEVLARALVRAET